MLKDLTTLTPLELRHLIRQNEYSGNTSGLAAGFTQANLVVLPKDLAYDFLLFTQRNPKPCPVLEVSDVGSKKLTKWRLTWISHVIFRSIGFMNMVTWSKKLTT